jgi:hypothetical protein
MHVPRAHKTPQWLTNILINTARTIQTDQPIGPLVQAGAALDYVQRTYGITSSISEILESQNIFIYPNPTQGLVYIQLPEITIQTIEVFDLLGQRIMHLNGDRESIDLSNLSAGLYVIKIFSKDGIFTQRVLKQ